MTPLRSLSPFDPTIRKQLPQFLHALVGDFRALQAEFLQPRHLPKVLDGVVGDSRVVQIQLGQTFDNARASAKICQSGIGDLGAAQVKSSQ